MALFLGLDCSTQSLTAVIIDTARRAVVHQHSVVFDEMSPGYGGVNGVLPNEDSLVKRSNPLMWVAALDQLLAELQASGVDLGKVEAISGSGQQHGTVYLGAEFQSGGWLRRDDPSLPAAVKPHLRRAESPIWMDSSTFADCRRIEAALGGRRRFGGGPALPRPNALPVHRSAPSPGRSRKSTATPPSFIWSVPFFALC